MKILKSVENCWCEVLNKESGYLCYNCESYHDSSAKPARLGILDRAAELMLNQDKVDLREFTALFWKREKEIEKNDPEFERRNRQANEKFNKLEEINPDFDFLCREILGYDRHGNKKASL